MAEYCDELVCLSHLRNYVHVGSSLNLCVLPMAVARFSSDCCYLLFSQTHLLTLQMYPPSEIEYQYHMAEGCTVDGKVFGKLQSVFNLHR